MASKEDPRIKNLRIKTGILKRLLKEETHYSKEVLQYKEKIAKMREDGIDEYLINKQGGLLAESEVMVPDCHRRVQAAYADLKTVMDQDWSELTDSNQYKTAQQILDENKELNET